MTLRLSRERAQELGMTIVEPPTQWNEIRAAIGRSVRIALSGRRPWRRTRRWEPEPQEQTIPEADHGVDTERD